MNTPGKIIINQSKCTRCKICANVCFSNFLPVEDGSIATLDSPSMCASCGHCVAACPADAIQHPAVPVSSCEPLRESSRLTYDQLMSFLKMRRSRREFTEQNVSRDVIDKLLAAAAQAPNGINRGNVQYTVIVDRQALDQIAVRTTQQIAGLAKLLNNPVSRFFFKLFNANLYSELEFFIPLMNQIGAIRDRNVVTYNAPCAILVHTTKKDMCGSEDSVYAASLIQYAAEALGLGTCCIGFITASINGDKALQKLVGLPNDHKIQTTLVVGYPEFRYGRSTPKADANVKFV